MKFRSFKKPFVALAMFSFLFAHEGGAQGVEAGEEQEYFLRQNAGEALLIRVEGFESLFESRVLNLDREMISVSGLPDNRIIPRFHWIGETEKSRQLDIRVRVAQGTNRSRFNVGLNRFEIRDNRSARLAGHYENLAFGMEPPGVESAANWSIKVNSLMNAARGFQSFGMEELRLWSLLAAAQLTQGKLGDQQVALDLVDEVLSAPSSRRHDNVRLSALQIRADGLMALAAAERSGRAQEGVLAVSEQLITQALALDFRFEQARALQRRGTQAQATDRIPEALADLQEALQVAVSIDAADLARGIREQLVELHGSRGDVAATGEVLEAIGTQLSREGDGDELALNLLAQGELQLSNFRFRTAKETLQQALALQNNSATRDRIQLALARAFFELGEWDEAALRARAVVERAQGEGFRRPTALLDVGAGLGMLATIARQRGEASDMRRYRNAQADYLKRSAERIEWTWSQAMDPLTGPGSDDSAIPWLERLADRNGQGFEVHRSLSRLWLCVLDANRCQNVSADQNRIQTDGTPAQQILGHQLWARIRLRVGDGLGARASLAESVRAMTFFRYSVPGVLGNAYWQQRESLASDYLSVLAQSGNPDAMLAGMAQLRWLAASEDQLALPFDPVIPNLDTDELRARLSSAARIGAPVSPTLVDEAFRNGRQEFDQRLSFLSEDHMRRWRTSLQPGEALLDLQVSGERPLMLLATREGVQQFNLPEALDLDDLAAAGVGAGLSDIDALHAFQSRWRRSLLNPVMGALPDSIQTVYFPAAGPMTTFPMAALRPELNWVRLASFPALPDPWARQSEISVDQVFVAGQPVERESGFPSAWQTDAELAAVMNQTIGPGLTVVQGLALLPDEFRTDAFQNASLIHLSMPVQLSFLGSEPSWFELSEPLRGQGRLRLNPADLTQWRTSAALVVLSQVQMIATDHALSSGRPPLVVELLSGGAAALLVSRVAMTEDARAEFVEQFYEHLNAGLPPTEALRQMRMAAVSQGSASGMLAFGFELWIQ